MDEEEWCEDCAADEARWIDDCGSCPPACLCESCADRRWVECVERGHHLVAP